MAELASCVAPQGQLQVECRGRDDSDRRITRLRLSPQGRQVFDSLHEHGVRTVGMAVAGMSADQLTQLQALLQQIRDNLEADDAGCP